MMKYLVAAALMIFPYSAAAHEFTPTYPVFEQSFVDNILVTNMLLFNRREDVTYYELGVFDEQWNPVPFAASNKIVKVKYLGRADIEIFVRESDFDTIEYICTTSKIVKGELSGSGVSSKICSRVK